MALRPPTAATRQVRPNHSGRRHRQYRPHKFPAVWTLVDELIEEGRLIAQAAMFGLSSPALDPPERELEDGQTLHFGSCFFQVIHTPGHSPGHVILHAEAQGLALVGDLVFAGSVGRTDLPGGDYQALFHSIRQHVLTMPDDTQLYTGHGPPTTVGRERTTNPFLIPHFGGELA